MTPPTPTAAPAKFKIAAIQMAMSPDPEQNLARAVELCGEAARNGAQIICLPELFRSQYFCQKEDLANFDLAEPIPGPSTAALGRVAAEHQVTIIASLFEKRAPGLFHNTVAMLGPNSGAPGEVPGLYRKMHIPDDPAYYEKYYFAPGDLGFKTFPTPHGPVAPLICWDQWYPEGARLAALRGALCLFYPTAIGWHPAEQHTEGPAQLDAWRTIQRSHAIANGVYVCAVNRTGHEAPAGGAGINFWGNSFICDPQGIVLAEASADKEETLYAEIDPARIEYIRRNWPFLRDRRVDAYTGIDQRFLG